MIASLFGKPQILQEPIKTVQVSIYLSPNNLHVVDGHSKNKNQVN